MPPKSDRASDCHGSEESTNPKCREFVFHSSHNVVVDDDRIELRTGVCHHKSEAQHSDQECGRPESQGRQTIHEMRMLTRLPGAWWLQ